MYKEILKSNIDLHCKYTAYDSDEKYSSHTWHIQFVHLSTLFPSVITSTTYLFIKPMT